MGLMVGRKVGFYKTEKHKSSKNDSKIKASQDVGWKVDYWCKAYRFVLL